MKELSRTLALIILPAARNGSILWYELGGMQARIIKPDECTELSCPYVEVDFLRILECSESSLVSQRLNFIIKILLCSVDCGDTSVIGCT